MAQFISQLPDNLKKQVDIIALGTNALATMAMVKAGAKTGASGKQAICYSIKQVDLIVAPIGVLIPNAMLGEVTPKIAKKIAAAKAHKIFLPVTQTSFTIVGLENKSMNQLIKETVATVEKFVKER